MKRVVISWLAGAALGLVILGAMIVAAPAREGYDQNGRPAVCNADQLDPEELQRCREWIGEVRVPAAVPRSQRGRCCGEADAYIADAFKVNDDGELVAIVTEDYPGYLTDDGEGDTAVVSAVPRGTEVVIPKDKINSASEDGGNPTGHGIIFMSASKNVYCYFGPTLAQLPGRTFAEAR